MKETLPEVHKNKWKALTAQIPWLTSRSLSLNTASRQGEQIPMMLKYAKDGMLNTGMENTAKSKYSGTRPTNQNYFPGREIFALAPALSGMLKMQ